MTDKEFQEFEQYATALKRQVRTRESALRNLVGAKILTPKGNFKKPYKILSKIFVDKH